MQHWSSAASVPLTLLHWLGAILIVELWKCLQWNLWVKNPLDIVSIESPSCIESAAVFPTKSIWNSHTFFTQSHRDLTTHTPYYLCELRHVCTCCYHKWHPSWTAVLEEKIKTKSNFIFSESNHSKTWLGHVMFPSWPERLLPHTADTDKPLGNFCFWKNTISTKGMGHLKKFWRYYSCIFYASKQK